MWQACWLDSFFLTLTTVPYPKRSTDKKAFGLAAVYLPDKLMQIGEFEEANKLLANYYLNNQKNATISIYYASSLLGCNAPEKAESVLYNLGIPKDVKSRAHYFYILAECYLIQKKNYEARQLYLLALKLPCSAKLTQLLIQKLNATRNE